jgi:hypothetical protein
MLLGRLRVPSTRPPVTSAPRIRVGLITFAAIATGIVAGLTAANGGGPFEGLRVIVPSSLARSQVARAPMSANVLFPAPQAQVVHQVVPIYYQPSTASSKQETEKQTMPAQVKPDDQPMPRPSTQPTPTGTGGGGDN